MRDRGGEDRLCHEFGGGCGTEEGADPTAGMSAREKKLWELQQRLRQSRKANQLAVVAEKKRNQRPEGADAGTEKRQWFEEKKKRRAEDLARLGVDPEKVLPPVPCNPIVKQRWWSETHVHSKCVKCRWCVAPLQLMHH